MSLSEDTLDIWIKAWYYASQRYEAAGGLLTNVSIGGTKFAYMGYHAVYGSTRIARGFCKGCNKESLIIDDKLLCCSLVYDEVIEGFQYVVSPRGKRKKPSLQIKEELLAIQNDRCFYCQESFGDFVKNKRKLIRLRVCYDHLVPFSYLQDNPEYNWVASCQICNGLKSNKMFDTVEEAITYVREKRGVRVKEAKVRAWEVPVLPDRIQKKKKASNILQRSMSREKLERWSSSYKISNKSNCNICGAAFTTTDIKRDFCSELCSIEFIKRNTTRELQGIYNESVNLNSIREEYLKKLNQT